MILAMKGMVNMDNYMDSFIKKVSGEEIIKANGEAEAQELADLKLAADNAAKTLATCDSYIAEARSLAQTNTESVSESIGEIKALIAEARGIQKDIEEAYARLKQSQDAEAASEESEAEAFNLPEKLAKIEELVSGMEEIIHKENVKVYRNVEAAFAAELKVFSQNLLEAEEVAHKQQLKVMKSTRLLVVFAFLFGLASVVLFVLQFLNIL